MLIIELGNLLQNDHPVIQMIIASFFCSEAYPLWEKLLIPIEQTLYLLKALI